MNMICSTLVFSIFSYFAVGQIANSTDSPQPCSFNFRKFASTMRLRRMREMARNFNVKWVGGNKVRRGFYDDAYNLKKLELDSLMNDVPCQWSCWGPWFTCTTSCGGGGVKERSRYIAIPASGGGKQCLASGSKQIQKCGEQECPLPVDCQLSGWSNYSSCSISCGPGGQMSRNRQVISQPMYGGLECSTFHLEESDECPLKECPLPVDCELSGWSNYSSCSISCGPGGQMSRNRQVISQPLYGGLECSTFHLDEFAECPLIECPECPAGWTRIGDDCYFKGQYSRTWHQAEEDCSQINPESHLVSLHSEQQANDLVNWSQFEQCIWLGAKRNTTRDPFTWSNGAEFNFTMWHYAMWGSRLVEACVLACTNDWDIELSWTIQACDLRQSFVATFCHISL